MDKDWLGWADSNPLLAGLESAALPVALHPNNGEKIFPKARPGNKFGPAHQPQVRSVITS